jgi:hypothetical protein
MDKGPVTMLQTSNHLPLITITTNAEWVTTLVIPTRHDNISERLAGLQLAHAICAKVIGAVAADWLGRHQASGFGPAIFDAMPVIKAGRQGHCWTVAICDGDDEDALASADALLNAAISAARDEIGFPTHRVERR